MPSYNADEEAINIIEIVLVQEMRASAYMRIL